MTFWSGSRNRGPSYPAHAGDPVRRGFSIPSQASLEYWVARSSRAMTTGNVARVLIPSLREAKQSRFGAANRDARIRMSARRWLLSFGFHKQRQGNELGEHREYDKCHTRLLIEQSRHDAADQPSDAIARIKQTEGQIAFALGQHTGHHRLEQGVLSCISDAPEHHACEERRGAAEE